MWLGWKSMCINFMVYFTLEEFVASRDEFVITVAPLPMEGGTGSPVNPLAIF
jgi:hypothetical protein